MAILNLPARKTRKTDETAARVEATSADSAATTTEDAARAGAATSATAPEIAAPATAAARGPEPVVLSAEAVEAIGRELDAIRDRVVVDLGAADRDYILRVVRTQRRLELAGRGLMFLGFLRPPGWPASPR